MERKLAISRRALTELSQWMSTSGLVREDLKAVPCSESRADR
jgi:hypothetical protein